MMETLIFLVLLLLVRFGESRTVEGDVRELKELYQALHGDFWTMGESLWELSTDPCDDGWMGITCEQSATDSTLFYVQKIELSDWNLIGELNESFLEFADLSILDLSYNAITGKLPRFQHHGSLEKIDLSWNRISGSVPQLQHLTKLTHLLLSGNLLTGQLPPFEGFDELITIDLSMNLINGSIPNFHDLLSLEFLNIGNNPITRFPSKALQNLPTLYSLTLSFLFIDTFPSIIDLPSLEELSLEGCQLVSIPDFVFQLTSLQTLILNKNNFKECSVQAPLLNLRELSVTNNIIDSCFIDLSSLPKIQILDLTSNHLTTLPQFSSICNLTSLIIQENFVQSSEMNSDLLPLLETLDLSYNRLPSFPNLLPFSNLKKLDLSNNLINGKIPFNGLTFPFLETLYLRRNQLSGTLPSFQNFWNLRRLDVAFNNFTGAVPIFAALTELTQLSIAGNSFSRLLSDSLTNLTSLTYLNLGYMKLNDFPASINLPELRELSLNGNGLSTVPDFVFSNLQLEYFFFLRNDLDSCEAFNRPLHQLTDLYLDYNHIRACNLSSELYPTLYTLSVGVNELTGVPAFTSPSNVRQLYIGDNMIEKLPDSFDFFLSEFKDSRSGSKSFPNLS